MKRASDEQVYPNMWDIPGGTLEDGEDPEAGAVRETKEETGIEIENGSLFACTSNVDTTKNKQYVRLEFIAKYNGQKITLNPKDHQEYAWVALSTLEKFECIPYMYEIAKVLENHALPIFLES